MSQVAQRTHIGAYVDLNEGTITVRRLLLPDGTPKAPKTAAGVRGR